MNLNQSAVSLQYVKSGRVKLKINFNQLHFAYKQNVLCPLTIINKELFFYLINPVSTSAKQTVARIISSYSPTKGAFRFERGAVSIQQSPDSSVLIFYSVTFFLPFFSSSSVLSRDFSPSLSAVLLEILLLGRTSKMFFHVSFALILLSISASTPR